MCSAFNIKCSVKLLLYACASIQSSTMGKNLSSPLAMVKSLEKQNKFIFNIFHLKFPLSVSVGVHINDAQIIESFNYENRKELHPITPYSNSNLTFIDTWTSRCYPCRPCSVYTDFWNALMINFCKQ